MKNYQILITAYTTIVVLGAEDEENAMTRAINEANFGDFKMDDASVEKEITSENDLERCIRHCDAVSKA